MFKRSQARRALGTAVALMLTAGACGGGSSTEATAATGAGDDALAAESATGALVVPVIGGGQIDFGDLEGQATVIWFWAPW